MLYKQSIRQLIAQGLFVLFALLLLNSIVFRHVHKLASGKIITHAHPYKPVGNSPYQPNNHTDSELYLLDLVSNGVFTTTPIIAMLVATLSIILLPNLTSFFCQQHTKVCNVGTLSLRGPPQA